MPSLVVPQHTPHPLKRRIRTQRLALWQIKQLLGGAPSECLISRVLNGIEPMPGDVERRLTAILDEIEASRRG